MTSAFKNVAWKQQKIKVENLLGFDCLSNVVTRKEKFHYFQLILEIRNSNRKT
jgi:hypothetical protein